MMQQVVEKSVIIKLWTGEVRRSNMFDVWKNVMMEIEQKVPHSSFVTWFDGITLVAIEDGVVKIGAPNIFKRKQLEAKFDKEIRAALSNNDVDFTDVEYVAQPAGNVKKKSREVVEDTAREERKIRLPLDSVARENTGTGLNSKYTLDSFIIGSNNDLAVSVAKAVIEKPGEKFNPFFLYGGPGLGKTHLVQAIGNELARRNPKLKILYTPINHFYSEFIKLLQKKQDTEAFRQKYSKLDVLIIDDFQFIAKKDASQVAFFDIFNDLHNHNKQIIVTSDRLPSEIETVDERLASRLAWAGPVDIQLPSFEDRCAILKSKAEFMGAEIEDEAIEYLAENVKTNIRDLEGELNHLLAFADLRGMTPLEIINNGYANTVSQSRPRKTVTARQIVDKVARFYDLSVQEMCGKSRVSNIKTARQVAMFLLSEELSMSTPKIALEVGVRDHTTVMHGIKKIKADMKLNFGLHSQIAELREKIYE